MISEAESKILIQIGEFLGLNLITGTKTISKLYRGTIRIPMHLINLFYKAIGKKPIELKSGIFNHEFKLNWGPFEMLKKKLLQY